MNIYGQDEVQEDDTVEITMESLNELREECKDIIETANAAKRLLTNPDFITVIEEGYFDKEPKRLGSLIASGRMPATQVEGAIEDLKSIGSCVTFLNNIVQKGEIANSELEAAEAAYNEAISTDVVDA